ncbi:putative alpha-N-acetylglucosaminidase [Auricularia subglabra TFB-10046 SS5]|nr:putative alpha-N-acetylglucosaminidase [Auricularia subglabra TFB-10046 SS5]
MRLSALVSGLVAAAAAVSAASSPGTQGLVDLVQRRIPLHARDFDFVLSTAPSNATGYDAYTVSTLSLGRVRIESDSLSGLATGSLNAIGCSLHRYLTDIVNVDIWWYIGSRLHLAPLILPRVNGKLTGAATVPWRYHFNTVTFSYTTAWWTWEDWELELDWLALRGVNLPLAWVGVERIIYDVFAEIGLTHQEIGSFLSGPAFQAWNRFGNIQGSWPTGSSLPMEWIDDQFELQKKIVRRMVELGMTPALPSFTGFVPRAISRVLPGASVVNGSRWSGFPDALTRVTFLEPFDPAFARLQKSFIEKQIAAYGPVSHVYTLDQYNENDPLKNDVGYLRDVSRSTWQSLKAADPDAIWLMQGWLFYSNRGFWTNARVEAFLGGVEKNDDMLILDLFSESEPQWQRTNSYYGKPWIWCQLHDYGGNLGLYGQVMNITLNAVEALEKSPSLVGFGLTMEGQEGNEIMYDLLLSQAWSRKPIDTASYFRSWATRRYNAGGIIGSLLPSAIYNAWDILRTTVYNNTKLASNAVTKSVFELRPALSGIANRTGHHATTITYDTQALVKAYDLFDKAAIYTPALWFNNPAYEFDNVDFARQVLSNAFSTQYDDLVATYNEISKPGGSGATLAEAAKIIHDKGERMMGVLASLDKVLRTSKHFTLKKWLQDARAWARGGHEELFEYNARNQITLWGPTGQINDYGSKAWGGLVSEYYAQRWRIFFTYLESVVAAGQPFNLTAVGNQFLAFQLDWQTAPLKLLEERETLNAKDVLAQVKAEWPELFAA